MGSRKRGRKTQTWGAGTGTEEQEADRHMVWGCMVGGRQQRGAGTRYKGQGAGKQEARVWLLLPDTVFSDIAAEWERR